jgi:hypothetical protein
MDQLVRGFTAAGGYDVNIYYLAARSQRISGAEAFRDADVVILAFPLYTDSMPGIVKEFIEMLQPYDGQEGNPKMGFVIQSGFPEPAHSRYVQQYLERLTGRLKAEYAGTVVKGGVEGIQIMPGWMTRKLYRRFYRLGKYLYKRRVFNPRILKKLAPWEQLPPFRLFMFRMMQRSRMANFYWNSQLKENGAFEKRFDRPFQVS